uniref:Putative LOV domain-containing protein n=1 Tax=Porella pinnata TaxID=56943 RepID=A0A126X3D9_9MARC|nr:putative LOV domain-containing protein [Porella pinnata]
MGKPFVTSQLELARNHERDSLDIFGQTVLSQHSYATGGASDKPLFSRAPGSAWNDALHAAEELFQGSGRPLTAAAGTRSSTPPDVEQKARPVVEHTEFSLNDLIVELEAAEQDSKSSPAKWQGVLSKMQMDDDHDRGQQRYANGNGYERQGRRSSDSGSRMVLSGGVSDDVISERAAQWGYGVVLKSSSRDSTPRTSSGSSAGGSGTTQAIPGVSRDVKDALASFQLAFLVCDATQHDFPILYASAGFTTMTGYSGVEIVGRNCRFLQGADTDRSAIAKLREALKNGDTYTGTLLNYKKDGTPFWNLLTISPIKDDEGKVIKYIGMQAEQNSKEQHPRNAKGQKSPAVRSTQGPTTFVPGLAAGAGGATHRRHSSSSLPKPPVVPQKPSPAAERRSAGPELHYDEHPQRRMSQRYSLTSNGPRSTRNSSVAIQESCEPDWREAALKLRVGLDGGKKSSYFETPEATAKVESGGLKSKSGRLTSRILRLFRNFKDSKHSKRQLETVSSGKDDFQFSDSEDERDDFNSTDNSTRTSVSRPRSSSIYSTTRNSESQKRPEASMEDLCDRLKERLKDNREDQQSPPSPSFDGNKRQFCIIHA